MRALQRLITKLLVLVCFGALVVTATFFVVGLTPELRTNVFKETVTVQTTTRYKDWVRQVVGSNFHNWGSSPTAGDITRTVAEKLPVTARVGLLAWALTWLCGLALGVLFCARMRAAGSLHVKWIYPIAQAIPKLPLFFLVYVIAARLQLATQPWSEAIAIASLALWQVPATAALWMNGIERVLAADFVRIARARGLRPLRLWRAHILPNVLSSSGVLSRIALSLVDMVVGSVLVDRIFSLGGIAEAFIYAVNNGQCEMAATASLIFFIPLASGVMVAELVVLWLDPAQERHNEV